MALPTIRSERLLLRPVEPTDLDTFAAFMADPEVVRFLGGSVRTREETASRVEAWCRAWALDGFGHFALERLEDGIVVGRTGLLVWELPGWAPTTVSEASGAYELELGWTLGRAYWGHGYATEAARQVRDFAFGELGRSRLISLVAPANVASAAVASRLGMTVEGRTIVQAMDVEIWSLSRDELERPAAWAGRSRPERSESNRSGSNRLPT